MSSKENTSGHGPSPESMAVARIKVELGPSFVIESAGIAASLRGIASTHRNAFLKGVLEHFAEHAEWLAKQATPEAAASLKVLGEQHVLQCVYYGAGSCPTNPDQCNVCCYFGNYPDPTCHCEAC